MLTYSLLLCNVKDLNILLSECRVFVSILHYWIFSSAKLVFSQHNLFTQ